MPPRVRRSAIALLPLLLPAPLAAADETPLAEYYGFTGLEIVRVGADCGPAIVADMDGDARLDLVIVNNRESRIEIHRQIPGATPEDRRAPERVNEFPEHWRFERELVPVVHRVSSVRATDFDGDGRLDLVYAGRPEEIVFLRREADGGFETVRRHPLERLSPARSAMVLADVVGDAAPELVAVVDGDVHVLPLDGTALGQPQVLPVGEAVAAFVEDFDGDGTGDVVAIMPGDAAPVRFWPGRREDGRASLGAQRRFELPALVDAKPVRLPGRDAALLAVIERSSKRVTLLELDRETVESSGDREASFTVHGHEGDDPRARSTRVVDLDGDGLHDLLATDPGANALVVHRHRPGLGLTAGERHGGLAKVDAIEAADVDGDGLAEVFSLSTEEGIVGRSEVTLDEDGEVVVSFPRPLEIERGDAPEAMALVAPDADGDPWRLAVVVRQQRDYSVDLLTMDGARERVELGRLSRSPDALLVVDADQDGRRDLLVLTSGKEPTLVLAPGAGEDAGARTLESGDMGQAGLVKSITPDSTGLLDVDGDGRAELLAADANFVRALRYDEAPGPGISPGWQVVVQAIARDPSAQLRTLTVLGDRVVAGDRENGRLRIFEATGERWRETESLLLRGFEAGRLLAGPLASGAEPAILAEGGDAFAVVRLAGTRLVLHELAGWQPDDEAQFPHELAVGDLNGDGGLELVVLDAGEQTCTLLAISDRMRLLPALTFTVFETRLFAGGGGREFEPNQAIVADLTGDGASDLVLMAHDRVLLYPQMTEGDEASPLGVRDAGPDGARRLATGAGG